MAIDIRKGSHMKGFPTKIASMMNQHTHVYNIVLTADCDNCILAGRGDYVHYDQYEQDDVPTDGSGVSATSWEGLIRDVAKEGGFEIETTKLPTSGEVLFIYNPPVSPYPNVELQDEKLYYNEKGEVAQGAVLAIGDVFAVENGFTGDPVVGKTVTFANGKYVVGA